MSALYKIEQAKTILGSVNAPALCYINMAEPLVEDDRTKTLMIDAHLPGHLYREQPLGRDDGPERPC